MAEKTKNENASEQSALSEIVDELPLDELTTQIGDYAAALGEKAIDSLSGRVDDVVEKLSSGSLGGGGALSGAVQKGAEKLSEGSSPLKAGLSGAATGVKDKVKGAFGGGGSGGNLGDRGRR